MGDRRCCCVCEIFNDNFTGANSDTVGNGWVEVDGDWDIVSNELAHVSGTPGMCLHDSVNWFGSNNMVVYAKIGGFVNGSKHRLIVQSNEDGSEYFYGEWHYQDSSNMYFSLGDESGVFKTIGPEAPVLDGQKCQLSITDGGQLCMSDISSRLTECVTPKDKDTFHYAGMANDGTVGITFDDWEFWAHLMDKEDCPVCDCSCEGWCIVDELVAEFEEIAYCPDMDGVTMDLDNTGDIVTGSHWYSAVTSCGTSPNEDIQLDMTCTGSAGVDSMRLDINVGSFVRKSDSAQYDYADPTVSTCDPLSLRFGPFNYIGVSGCAETTCCHGFPCPPDGSDFYIWVTERP